MFAKKLMTEQQRREVQRRKHMVRNQGRRAASESQTDWVMDLVDEQYMANLSIPPPVQPKREASGRSQRHRNRKSKEDPLLQEEPGTSGTSAPQCLPL